MDRDRNEIIVTVDESKTCLLDGKVFNSSKKMIWHVRRTYKLSFEQYVIKVFYGGVKPVCLKTGRSLTFKANKLGPWFKNFTTNSFPRKPHSKESKEKIKVGCERSSLEKYGVKNIFSTDWCKQKIKNSMLERFGVDNIMKVDEYKSKVLSSFFETIKVRPKKTYLSGTYDQNKSSSLEKDLMEKLNSLDIRFESPFMYEGKKYDFYIPSINVVIELDGDAFHKDVLEKMTVMTINSSVNDFTKNKLIENTEFDFYRIRYNTNTFLLDDGGDLLNKIESFQYSPSYSISYKQKVVHKEYFKRYIDLHGKEKLKNYSYLFLKFIRTFQPTFPYPDLEENLQDVGIKLKNYDVSKIYNESTMEFSNNISTVGHNYLKHYFRSYWGAKYKGNMSPEESWGDDKIMSEVIRYRIGLNNSGEVFDFSLHQLVRGLSARRITASFFKPLLASAIYYKYIGDKNDPVVLDPCCGFGGRLLGFKSKYPNGIYIGCEPNIETFNELQELVKNANWNDVKIYNCKFEDFNSDIKFDLIFTSIPYYDLETYSNSVSYSSFDEWKDTFIKSFEKYSSQNCYINMSEELSIRLGFTNLDAYIVSNRSHFDGGDDQKREVIVKL